MADGLNKVMLFGNLGADPELRVTPSGQSVLNLRLATTESYLDRNNTRQERTEWHSVAIWGKRADALAKFLGKGDKVFIEGGIRTSTYEKNGEKRYRTEIVAQNIILGGGRGKGDGQTSDAPRDRAPTQTNAQPSGGGDDFAGFGSADDSDIPFIHAGRTLEKAPSWERR